MPAQTWVPLDSLTLQEARQVWRKKCFCKATWRRLYPKVRHSSSKQVALLLPTNPGTTAVWHQHTDQLCNNRTVFSFSGNRVFLFVCTTASNTGSHFAEQPHLATSKLASTRQPTSILTKSFQPYQALVVVGNTVCFQGTNVICSTWNFLTDNCFNHTALVCCVEADAESLQ